MTVNQKVTGRAMSVPAGIGVGAGISMLLTVLGCALIAWLLDGEMLEENSIGYGAMGILLLASWAGAQAASILVKHRKLLVCMTTGGVYFALLLLINGLAFGGYLNGVAVTLLLILGGCAAALLMNSGREKTGKKRRYGKNVQKLRHG